MQPSQYTLLCGPPTVDMHILCPEDEAAWLGSSTCWRTHINSTTHRNTHAARKIAYKTKQAEWTAPMKDMSKQAVFQNSGPWDHTFTIIFDMIYVCICACWGVCVRAQRNESALGEVYANCCCLNTQGPAEASSPYSTHYHRTAFK